MRILCNEYKRCSVLLGAVFFSLHSALYISCTQDNNDKGEGEYSLMRADFVEAHVGSDKRVDYAVTDDGDSLAAEPHFTIKAIETADTIYLAALYYNKVKNDAGKWVADARSMSLVPTLFPIPVEEIDEMKTHPVKFESLWLAANGRYLNVSIILMTGQPDSDDMHQTVALVQDSVVNRPDGRLTACCRLYHDQGGVPEYYSLQRFLSIPARSILADSLQLEMQTYEGIVVRTIALK